MYCAKVNNMSSLSIKQRVTIYYAAILLIFSTIIMTVFYFTLDLQFIHVSQSVLEKSVKNAFDDIDMPGEWLEVSNDFDFYNNGVTLLIYGAEGTKVMGQVPEGFPEEMPLKSDSHQEYTGGNENWQVYDLFTEYPNGNGIWVRGIYSLSSSLETLGNLLVIMLVALPVFILISLTAGYYITSRAFVPVNQIQQTAEMIIKQGDLSRRINLQKDTGDELYKLAQTYDHLLERIEQNFENEKQFTSDVSHELRTPVSVIISQAEYGLSQEDPQVMEDSLRSILRKSQQMSNMIAQLLDLSRTENKLHNMKKESFNLAELCELVADEFTETARQKNIQIIRKLDQDIIVQADQTLLMRAIINLVSNGITYGRENGFVMLELHREDDNISLNISDNGIGIAAEHLKKIFNRFYRADKARSRNPQDNTGLGLAMVKQIIEAHSGTISVQSTAGTGSSFTIRLPYNQA